MKRTKIMATSALAGGLLLALAVPLSASAHVSVDAASTAAGSYTVLTFSVPHGCDGSATTSIAIGLPETVVEATPTVNPNWTISEKTEPLDEPLTLEDGDQLTDRVSQVVYTAITPLAADQRDTFELALALPGKVGDVLEFPVTQTCEVGQTLWQGDEVPSITLTAAADGDGHSHGSVAAAASSDDVLARVLGIGGLVIGAIGLVVGISGRRRAVN